MPSLDIRRVRGVLAEHKVTHKAFAQACGLGRPYTSTLLTEKQQPGELATFKLWRGLQRLGLDQEAARG